jgi:DNA-directed RNA polymerase subunit H (RpoH/RPB5)
MSSEKNSQLITEIYTSRLTIIKQLSGQGYDVKDYDNFSAVEVNAMKNNNQLDMLVKKDDKKIYVKYHFKKMRPGPELQTMVEDMFSEEGELNKEKDLLYIITIDNVSDTVSADIKRIWETEKIYMIIQPMKNLLYNVLENVFVPPHRVLSPLEKNELLQRYNCTEKELPEISYLKDPVCHAIFMRPGEVCEISRPSKTAITSLYYRICV